MITRKHMAPFAHALQTVAAEWFVRIQSDDLSTEELAELQHWLAANDEHRKAFERIESLWQDFERLPNKTPPTVPAPRWRLPHVARFSAIAAGILVMAVLGTWYSWQGGGWVLSAGSVFETQLREHREVTLADGSRLALGGHSLASVRFDDARREVNLERGEAFFEVAKDVHRPFVVRVGESTITAVGTAFNVRRSGERTIVVVTEGTVNVLFGADEPSTTAVSAGQKVALQPSQRIASVHAAPPGAASAWRSGRLEYLGEPLKYVVADVNRYATRRITIEDPRIGDMLITGTVFENDIDAWLRSAEVILPVTVDRSEQDRIVLRQR